MSRIRAGLRYFTQLLFAIFGGFAVVVTLSGILVLGYLWLLNASLPSYDELAHRDVPESSKIYSRDGTLLYSFHGEYNRTRIGLDRIPPDLLHATIAVEDKDFYQHGAISLSGIIRAVLVNYRSGNVVQGGSTITQQFVKNALLDRQKSFGRKIREVLLAYKVESHFSKDQILELYLNEIPYGRNAYGVEAAAQTYFDKSALELNLAESAYLAALPQAPSYLSPTGPNLEALRNRQQTVLDLMVAQGYISAQQAQEAKSAKVSFRPVRTDILAPYFVSWIQNYLTEKYGKEFLQEGGLRVYTTLDLQLQKLAETVVKEGAEENSKKYNAYNAALVAVEPNSGKVLAMAGGKDYWGTPAPTGCTVGRNCKFEPNVNVATALRQPGSSFKPYAYLTAFSPEHGYSPLSRILDAPTVFGSAGGKPYAPKNYDGSYHGLITFRKALAGSLNVPAVKVLQAVGVNNVVNTAKNLGITAPLKNCGLTLVLGGCEIKLVDHVGAMAVIANGGKGKGATPFLRIEDKNGKVLEEYQVPSNQAVSPEAAYSLISVMTDDASRQFVFGPKNPLTLPDRIVAAKTGTTQNWKDGWTVGFTPQLAAGVWVGNNDSSLMKAGADGVFVAAPLWQKFMIAATKDLPVQQFAVPPGVIEVAFDASTNRLASGNSSNIRMEPFPWYALPKEMKIPASPRNLMKGLFTPLDQSRQHKPTLGL